MAFAPTKNLLVWTDSQGDITRWRDPIPVSAPDPVKPSTGSSVGIPVKRKNTPTLFDDDAEVEARKERSEQTKGNDAGVDDDLAYDIDNDDWILDDVGVMNDDDGEEKRLTNEGGMREMGMLQILGFLTSLMSLQSV